MPSRTGRGAGSRPCLEQSVFLGAARRTELAALVPLLFPETKQPGAVASGLRGAGAGGGGATTLGLGLGVPSLSLNTPLPDTYSTNPDFHDGRHRWPRPSKETVFLGLEVPNRLVLNWAHSQHLWLSTTLTPFWGFWRDVLEVRGYLPA